MEATSLKRAGSIGTWRARRTGRGGLRLHMGSCMECPVLNTAVNADDGNPILRSRVGNALRSWTGRLQACVEEAQQQPDAKPDVDPKDVATLIVASLEGALVMSRIQRNDEAPRRVQSHLNKCLDQRSGDGLQVSEMEHLYLEDLHVGQRFRSGTHVMEEAKIKDFATEFDPQPFHLDEIAARASIFKGLAASGWHTAAIAMRLLVTGGLPLANGIIGLGGEIAWPRPTRPGDSLHIDSEILDITPSRSKPNQAVVSVRSTMLNQKDEPVYVLNAKVLVFKRPSSREETEYATT